MLWTLMYLFTWERNLIAFVTSWISNLALITGIDIQLWLIMCPPQIRFQACFYAVSTFLEIVFIYRKFKGPSFNYSCILCCCTVDGNLQDFSNYFPVTAELYIHIIYEGCKIIISDQIGQNFFSLYCEF